MSSPGEHPEPAASDDASASASDERDGRVQRRQRNMAAVRLAVLDLLREGEHPTLASIAARADVATRSIYRYFGDADAAVQDAVGARRERVAEVFEAEPRISPNAPLSERLGMLVLRRLRLDRLVEPLDGCGGFEDFLGALDTEVREALAPELASGDDELELLVCGLFRPRGIRAMREIFGDRDQGIASALIRMTSALLAGPRTAG